MTEELTITEFIEAQLARVEQDRCNGRTITAEPVTVGGHLVQYVGMSGDCDGTYIEVRDPRADAMTPPGEDVPLITRILTPAEQDEFWEQLPLSDRAQEWRRWVAAIRAVVEMHGKYPDVGMGYSPDDGHGYGDIASVCASCGTPDEYGTRWPCGTIRAVAGIWAGEDGWQEEWA